MTHLSEDTIAALDNFKSQIDEHEELLASHERLEKALLPFAHFATMFAAKPLGGMSDTIYGIHAGTEWEAAISRTDCKAALEALKLIPKGE